MKVVAVSGGFDPLHPGHIKYIEEAITLGDRLLIILTRNEQLIQKDRLNAFSKGRDPIPYEVRKDVLLWGLGGRGEVVCNIDEDITARESLRYYRPHVFAKGGDTWDAHSLPEQSICDELGIDVVYGVGGYNKSYSSSQM